MRRRRLVKIGTRDGPRSGNGRGNCLNTARHVKGCELSLYRTYKTVRNAVRVVVGASDDTGAVNGARRSAVTSGKIERSKRALRRA
jgi:hypothetical protein